VLAPRQLVRRMQKKFVLGLSRYQENAENN
jgi:hypothetical protein